jgi:hypothetical protein
LADEQEADDRSGERDCGGDPEDAVEAGDKGDAERVRDR